MRGLILTLLVALPFINAATLSYDFHVTQQNVTLSPGLVRSKLIVNGQYPGPLIRAPVNSNVAVNLYNDLPDNYTTIHWHGLNQRGTPYYDGFPTQSQCAIPPLTKMVYNLNPAPAGSTMWHAHFREQLMDGLYGPFIVEDEPGSFPFHYDEERVIMLTDAYNLTSWEEDDLLLNNLLSAISANVGIGDPAPDQTFLCVYNETTTPATSSCSSTIDGKGFNMNFQSGRTYRLRLICSSELAPFLFSIDEHELQVVTADYAVLDGGAWVQSVPLMTGQRYDVLVRAKDNVPAGKKFWARSTVQGQCVDAGPTNVTSDVRGVVTYGDTTSSTLPTSISWNATNPNCVDLAYGTTLRPYVKATIVNPEPALTMWINYTFPTVVNGLPEILVDGSHYNVDDFAYPTLFHINEDPTWTPTTSGEERNLFIIPDDLLGKEIRLILHSYPARDGRNHPFHHHGGGYKFLASGVSNITQADLDKITHADVLAAVERDTIVVPKNGWVVTQFTADNPGVWALHCHIGFHLKPGMIAQFVIAPNAIQKNFVIPPELKSMCTTSS